MIVNNTFYSGELYIPQAKPSITNGIGTDDDFAFINNQYEEDCLIKCLGSEMYNDLVDNIDTGQANLLKVTADTKWDYLINGERYIINSKNKSWRGLRFKSPITNSTYNFSLLAYYVFFHYEKHRYSIMSRVGERKISDTNARQVYIDNKAIFAWNKFVELVVGDNKSKRAYFNSFNRLVGVDHFNHSGFCTLYEYIEDVNNLRDSFPNFTKNSFNRIDSVLI